MNYTVSDHLHMINDPVRFRAYSQALENIIVPGSIVVDIGSGIGTWALLACKYGARKVYAIEPVNLIQVARELAEANGFGDRIECIQAMSTDIELPEKADLVVSDLRGSTPFFEGHIASVMDARRRFLKSTGTLVPMKDRILLSAVQAPAIARSSAPLDSKSLGGLDFSIAHDYATNVAVTTQGEPELELTELMSLGEIDYRQVDSPDFSGSATAVIQHTGVMHGLCVWFETELAPGIGFSTANRANDRCIYGSLFLPWSEAVRVESGGVLKVDLEARASGHGYLWDWRASVRSIDNRVIADLAQNSLLGIPLSLDRLKKRAGTFVPGLKPEGEVLAMAIDLMKEHKSVDEIAHALAGCFPEQFPGLDSAMEKTRDIVEKYSA